MLEKMLAKIPAKEAGIAWDKVLAISLTLIGFVFILAFFTSFQSKSLEALDLSACKVTLTMSQFSRQQINIGPAHINAQLPNLCRETLPVDLTLPTNKAHNLNDFEHEIAILLKKSWDMIGGGSAGSNLWENAFFFSLIHSPKDKCLPVFVIKLRKTHFFKEGKSFTPMDLLLYLASTPSGSKYKCIDNKCYDYSYLQYITLNNGFLFIDLDPQNAKQEFKPEESYVIAIFSPSSFEKYHKDVTLKDAGQELKERGIYNEFDSDELKEINFVGCPSCYSATYLDSNDANKVKDEITESTNGIIITEYRRLRALCNVVT